MSEAYICEAIRTPIGRFGGALSTVRPDDMLAHVMRSVMEMDHGLKGENVDDVLMGCVNQAGEDNRNVARMAVLLSGMPDTVPGATVNRLCGSGLEALGQAARAIRCGEADVIVAGGVESMSRAPFVMGKAETAFSRNAEMFDTTIGWRFVNPLMKKAHGIDSMPETAENVAERYQVSRSDQDAFALGSQEKAAAAQASGRLAKEIVSLEIPQRRKDPIVVDRDEHPRATTLEKLASLGTPFRDGGTITAGNASGVNDGAAALIVASGEAVQKYGLTPKARIVGMGSIGVEPRVMGIGPAPSSANLLERLGLSISDMDIIELNEAFAAQGLAVLRQLGVQEDAEHVNPNGGAIALGHPLGMSGARLAMSAAIELQERDAKLALCTMCIGVGQGISLVLEKA